MLMSHLQATIDHSDVSTQVRMRRDLCFLKHFASFFVDLAQPRHLSNGLVCVSPWIHQGSTQRPQRYSEWQQGQGIAGTGCTCVRASCLPFPLCRIQPVNLSGIVNPRAARSHCRAGEVGTPTADSVPHAHQFRAARNYVFGDGYVAGNSADGL